MFQSRTAQVLTLSALSFTAGCSKQSTDPADHVGGVVTSEIGNLPSLTESRGAVFGNESVKISDRYAFTVNVDGKNYSIEVDSTDLTGSSGPHTVTNLDAAIEVGTKVKFPLTLGGKPLFSPDGLGIVDPDDITIVQD